MKTSFLGFFALAGVSLLATTAAAADLVPPPPPAPTNSVFLEFSPEFKTTDSSWTDDYARIGISHTFDGHIVWSGVFQYTGRATSDGDYLETSLGYKYKMGAFTLTPSALLGYGFGNQPGINASSKGDADAYYALSLAGDYKIDNHWTWNAFSARYRNAFNTTWITPKVTTGVTYNIDTNNAVYTNVGYAWKDTGNGQGLQADKWNILVGYKYMF